MSKLLACVVATCFLVPRPASAGERKQCALVLAVSVGLVGLAATPRILKYRSNMKGRNTAAETSEVEAGAIIKSSPSAQLTQHQGYTYFVQEGQVFRSAADRPTEYVENTSNVISVGTYDGELWMLDSEGDLYFQKPTSGLWVRASSDVNQIVVIGERLFAVNYEGALMWAAGNVEFTTSVKYQRHGKSTIRRTNHHVEIGGTTRFWHKSGIRNVKRIDEDLEHPGKLKIDPVPGSAD